MNIAILKLNNQNKYSGFDKKADVKIKSNALANI